MATTYEIALQLSATPVEQPTDPVLVALRINELQLNVNELIEALRLVQEQTQKINEVPQ